MMHGLRAVAIGLALLGAGVASSVRATTFGLEYTIELFPKQDQARVTMALGKGGDRVMRLRLHFDPRRYSDFVASGGTFTTSGSGKAVWAPSGEGSKLSWRVRVSHEREAGDFDARMTADWAIFRGDKIVPFIAARMKKGAESVARLRFVLPPGWTFVDTGWIRHADGAFLVENRERRFDRPIGWIVAGKIGTRRDRLGLTELAIAAPHGDAFDRMGALTFIHLLWPEIEAAFGRTPPKILIVGADDPMWRGGLSAPNSLFIHTNRPLVSENGTSTLIHELTHVITRIRARDRSDWLTEGLAEFYSVDLIWRAGGMSDQRRAKVFADLRAWGRDVKSLRTDRSSAKITARAAVLLDELDREIRYRSRNEHNLDDVTRRLRQMRVVSTRDLMTVVEEILGGPAQTLATPLLQ